MSKRSAFRTTVHATGLVWKLFRKPGDIESLLGLGNLLNGLSSFHRYVGQVKADQDARVLVDARYSPGLPSMEALGAMPTGSLGHGLFLHLTTHKLGLYPFPLKPEYDDGQYLRERQREIHDLLHTL